MQTCNHPPTPPHSFEPGTSRENACWRKRKDACTGGSRLLDTIRKRRALPKNKGTQQEHPQSLAYYRFTPFQWGKWQSIPQRYRNAIPKKENTSFARHSGVSKAAPLAEYTKRTSARYRRSRNSSTVCEYVKVAVKNHASFPRGRGSPIIPSASVEKNPFEGGEWECSNGENAAPMPTVKGVNTVLVKHSGGENRERKSRENAE